MHSIIDKYAERGLRSLAVARQVSWVVFSLYHVLVVFVISEPCSCTKCDVTTGST